MHVSIIKVSLKPLVRLLFSDVTDKAAVESILDKSRIKGLGELGVETSRLKDISGEDDSFWDIVRNNSQRIVQECSFNSRDRVYQFRDYIAYLNKQRTSFVLIENSEVFDKGCIVPQLD